MCSAKIAEASRGKFTGRLLLVNRAGAWNLLSGCRQLHFSCSSLRFCSLFRFELLLGWGGAGRLKLFNFAAQKVSQKTYMSVLVSWPHPFGYEQGVL